MMKWRVWMAKKPQKSFRLDEALMERTTENYRKPRWTVGSEFFSHGGVNLVEYVARSYTRSYPLWVRDELLGTRNKKWFSWSRGISVSVGYFSWKKIPQTRRECGYATYDQEENSQKGMPGADFEEKTRTISRAESIHTNPRKRKKMGEVKWGYELVPKVQKRLASVRSYVWRSEWIKSGKEDIQVNDARAGDLNDCKPGSKVGTIWNKEKAVYSSRDIVLDG